ncbi:MAG: PEP-CTERM sorting domain-containing protein [Rubrivivax sp.]|nr:PEP-CTERM sorting domain-containing protein [Rubrivivax sp.]
MKKTLIMASLIAAVGVMAQGTLTPANIGGGINVPFDDAVTGAKLGNTYQAQILVGADEASLAPVGAPIVFAGNGYFTSKTMTFDGTGGLPQYAAGANVFVRVDVFPVGYANWGTAAAAMQKVGQSNVIPVKLGNWGDPPALPAALVGLQAVHVAVIPEPSVLALIGLGAAALLLRRRS